MNVAGALRRPMPALISAVHVPAVSWSATRSASVSTRVAVPAAKWSASNLKLASGLCPVAELLRAGVNVALGTAGAASNNRLDLWAELERAALLAKQVAGNAAAVTAAQALRMATINGARALGLGNEIGSLVAGKAADVICVDLSGVEHHPLLDPVSQLVYAASRHDVTDVWIAGEQLVADRTLLRLETADVCAAAERWARQLRA